MSGSTYEGECVIKDGVCFSAMEIPLAKTGVMIKQIDVGIAIKQDWIEIRFKDGDQYLSTAGQGWNTSGWYFEEIKNKPQIIELYYPDPSIAHDPGVPALSVIRPPNRLITEIKVEVHRD